MHFPIRSNKSFCGHQDDVKHMIHKSAEKKNYQNLIFIISPGTHFSLKEDLVAKNKSI